MKNIIGLGLWGCEIASCFEQFSSYSVYKLGSDVESGPNCHHIPHEEQIEKYEENLPQVDFLKDLEGEVLLILSGIDKESAAAFAVLEQVKHTKLNILYVKNDMSFASEPLKLLDNLIIKVFSESARSGMFDKVFVVSTEIVENFLSDLTILNFKSQISSLIANTMMQIIFFMNSKSAYGKVHELPIGARLFTIGVLGEDEEENLFFPLDNITDVQYYVACNRERLEKDKDFFKEVKNTMKRKTEKDFRVSFGIYEQNQVDKATYCLATTSVIA